jgi:hypothetical protein
VRRSISFLQQTVNHRASSKKNTLSLSGKFGNANQPSKGQDGAFTTSRLQSNVWDHYSIVEDKEENIGGLLSAKALCQNIEVG